MEIEHERDAPPELLAETILISDVFLELRERASGNGWGAAPISWVDIDAYSRVRRIRLDGWTVNLIRACDQKFIKYEQLRAEKK